jgi:hypothetical protein
MDAAGTQSWTSQSFYSNAAGLTTFDYIYGDTGDSSYGVWTAGVQNYRVLTDGGVNDHDWNRILVTGASDTAITRRVTEYDDDRDLVEVFDLPDAFEWASEATLTDAQGRVTRREVEADDGASVVTLFDAAAAASWATIETRYDTADRFTGLTTSYDDGTKSVRVNDVTGTTALDTRSEPAFRSCFPGNARRPRLRCTAQGKKELLSILKHSASHGVRAPHLIRLRQRQERPRGLAGPDVE